MINIEEEIKILEDAATQAQTDCQNEIDEKKRLEQANRRLADDKINLIRRIEAEQGDLTTYKV